jgi:hypothetical protein
MKRWRILEVFSIAGYRESGVICGIVNRSFPLSPISDGVEGVWGAPP